MDRKTLTEKEIEEKKFNLKNEIINTFIHRNVLLIQKNIYTVYKQSYKQIYGDEIDED